MKYMDKFNRNINKRGLLFLIGISLIGFIFGCLFILIISKSDKNLVKEYLSSFLENLKTDKINYFDLFKNTFFNNFMFISTIFIIGMSVIGMPINLFYFFLKNFILGFTMTAFILTYSIKGCIFSLIYIIPHNLINMFLYIILVYYSLNFSIKLVYSIVKKRSINFKNMVNKYFKIFIITCIGIIVTALYESLILPNIMKKLLFIIK